MDTQELICSHMDFAQSLAKVKKQKINGVYYEELESAAYRGLVDAANSYTPSLGTFKAFSAKRIIGEMDDYLRELGWGSRRNKVEVCSLDTNLEDDSFSKEDLTELVDRLPKEARKYLTWYYCEGLTMQQIADLNGISKALVSVKLKRYKAQARSILICS
jgi:RNA polymerase sigma factor (sigma-70 family)